MLTKTSLLWVILALALLAGILKIVILLAEPYLTFFPSRERGPTPRVPGVSLRTLEIQTEDGVPISAWWLEHPSPIAEVLFFHGNAGNLWLWQEFLLSLYRHHLSVLALDYRGYGQSGGSPTEAGLYRDARALVRHFWGHHHQSGVKVLYWGRSLGGPVAAFAARIHPPQGLILEATFRSKSTLLRHSPLLWFLSWFSRYRFATLEHLGALAAPVLVIHGDRDRVVPFQEGERLFQALPGPKSFLRIEGADHNDIQDVASQLYWERITAFIEDLGHGPNSHH